MISAYAVMDSVNKYRHGVLLGNYVEDKFGNDLADKVTCWLDVRAPTRTLRKYLPPSSTSTLHILCTGDTQCWRIRRNVKVPYNKQPNPSHKTMYPY